MRSTYLVHTYIIHFTRPPLAVGSEGSHLAVRIPGSDDSNLAYVLSVALHTRIASMSIVSLRSSLYCQEKATGKMQVPTQLLYTLKHRMLKHRLLKPLRMNLLFHSRRKIERRIARDGKSYTMQEFRDFYFTVGWLGRWEAAKRTYDTHPTALVAEGSATTAIRPPPGLEIGHADER